MDDTFPDEIEKIRQEADDSNKGYAIETMSRVMMVMTFRTQFAES